MTPAVQPLFLRRNASCLQEWQLVDASGTVLDLTGCSAALEIRLYGAQPGAAPLTMAATVIEPAFGIVQVVSSQPAVQAAFDAMGGGPEAGDPITGLAYDLRITRPDGTRDVPISGPCTIYPGVTVNG